MKILFIGAGKMATAIAGGLLKSDTFTPGNICAADISENARKAFTEKTGIQCSESPDAFLGNADIIILAVKPQYAREAVEPIAKKCADKLIISIAAGLTLASLTAWFGHKRIVRTMPNTPLMVGCGATVYAPADDVSAGDCENTEKIFRASGIVYRVQENAIDAVTAVSGSGPAYIFEIMDSMKEAGIECGLSEELALILTAQTVKGAGEMILQSMGTPCELRKAVTSPGGTTEAALKVMDSGGFRELMKKAVKAAYNRSLELGGEK